MAWKWSFSRHRATPVAGKPDAEMSRKPHLVVEKIYIFFCGYSFWPDCRSAKFEQRNIWKMSIINGNQWPQAPVQTAIRGVFAF